MKTLMFDYLPNTNIEVAEFLQNINKLFKFNSQQLLKYIVHE
jgi:hypothetical protein